MTVKFFAYLREYTKCKIVDFPYQEDVRKLTLALSETYGSRLREKLLTPGRDRTGRGDHHPGERKTRGEHLGGIDTKLSPTDVVSIFPLWWLAVKDKVVKQDGSIRKAD